MDVRIKGMTIGVIATLFAMRQWSMRPIRWEDTRVLKGEPIQILTPESESWSHKGAKIIPLATYDISARVVAIEHYSTDSSSFLSPIDFSVAWGPVSKQKVMDTYHFSISDRFLSCYPDGKYDYDDLAKYIANMHLIPGNGQIEKELNAVKIGQGIQLKGHLVEARKGEDWFWKSSLSRLDSGNGACEVMWVDEVYSL
jgi:hypothetical protein